jgi:hypothetical protein
MGLGPVFAWRPSVDKLLCLTAVTRCPSSLPIAISPPSLPVATHHPHSRHGKLGLVEVANFDPEALAEATAAETPVAAAVTSSGANQTSAAAGSCVFFLAPVAGADEPHTYSLRSALFDGRRAAPATSLASASAAPASALSAAALAASGGGGGGGGSSWASFRSGGGDGGSCGSGGGGHSWVLDAHEGRGKRAAANKGKVLAVWGERPIRRRRKTQPLESAGVTC